MYYPQAPKEPSGCLETWLITRVIFGMLALPLLIIAGSISLLVLTLYAFTVSPALALIPVGIGAVTLIGFARWERARIDREHPPEDM